MSSDGPAEFLERTITQIGGLMAKKVAASKKAKSTSTPAADQPVRICFERILPDDLDPERMVRRQLRQQMIDAAGGAAKLKAEGVYHIARMAVPISKKWPPGSTLRCRFLDGSKKMRAKVKAVALEWQKYADIKLKFVSSGDAEVRISALCGAPHKADQETAASRRVGAFRLYRTAAILSRNTGYACRGACHSATSNCMTTRALSLRACRAPLRSLASWLVRPCRAEPRQRSSGKPG
jgi:hypothetical protein